MSYSNSYSAVAALLLSFFIGAGDYQASRTTPPRKQTAQKQAAKPSSTVVFTDVAEKAGLDRKSTRLNSSHLKLSRMPSSA